MGSKRSRKASIGPPCSKQPWHPPGQNCEECDGPCALNSSSALVLTPVEALTFTLSPLPASAPSWWNPKLEWERTATAKVAATSRDTGAWKQVLDWRETDKTSCGAWTQAALGLRD